MIEWVDVRLRKWGDFMRGVVDLGYPKQSVESKMNAGKLEKGGKQAPDPFVPPEVAEAERILLLMPTELKEAAKVRYCCSGSMERQARKLSQALSRKISRRNYTTMIDRLHDRYDMAVKMLELGAK